jgi:peroxiredoxin Q/BCP
MKADEINKKSNMKLIISLLLMITLQTQAQQQATDFAATSMDGQTFRLSDLKGKKIFLSFFRNGACALCNLRVHEISQHQKAFDEAGIVVIAVFESPAADMKPYVGQQKPDFVLLSDPDGKLYEKYGIKTSSELVNAVMSSPEVGARVKEADEAGFKLTPQQGSNFFRIPAEVLIDEDFNIVKIHHCDQLINHLPIEEVLRF